MASIVEQDNYEPGKLFIGGLSWVTTKESLEGYFKAYGDIQESIVMCDKETGKPRGFGFVTYAVPEDAEKVLRDPHHVLDQKQIDPKRAVKGTDVASKHKVFVGGISSDTTTDDIIRDFMVFGELDEKCIDIKKNDDKKHRGFGFVTFKEKLSMDKAIAQQWVDVTASATQTMKKVEVKVALNVSKGQGVYSGYHSGFDDKAQQQHFEYSQFQQYPSYTYPSHGTPAYPNAAHLGYPNGSAYMYGTPTSQPHMTSNYDQSYSGFNTTNAHADATSAYPYAYQQQQPPQQQQQQQYSQTAQNGSSWRNPPQSAGYAYGGQQQTHHHAARQ